MKSKLIIAAFVLAIISSFSFVDRDNTTKSESDQSVKESKPTQGFVLEDDVNW